MILLGFVHPADYLAKVAGLLIGCLILGSGVYMEVLADVVMLPGESFVRAVVFCIHSEFGFTKVCFDVSMAVIAAALSVLLSGHLEGVREGTIVAAVLVGFIARSIGKHLSFLPVLIYGDDKEEEEKIEEELKDVYKRQIGYRNDAFSPITIPIMAPKMTKAIRISGSR